jgi:hypothetical protein
MMDTLGFENVRKVTAAVAKAIKRGTALDVFITSTGELFGVSLTKRKPTEEDFRYLEEEKQMVTKMTFGVCRVRNGKLERSGEPLKLASLPKAIEEAQAERIHFYTEREKGNGPRAWPVLPLSAATRTIKYSVR